jgi:hypothetical protein
MNNTILFFLIVIAIGCDSCNPNSESARNQKSDFSSTVNPSSTVDTLKSRKPEIESIPISPAEENSNWEYRSEEDKMTSKTSYFASIDSKNKLNFDFPYNGGSFGRLTIRKKRGETNVFLQISKGQFKGTFDGGTVRIRFDNNPPKRYSFLEASDGSSDILFLQSEREIIKRMKASNSMLIEAEFYNEGNRLLEFDIAGLRWEQ